MAAIDRAQLLEDTKTWLPANNVLTDAQMTAIIDNVVDTQIPADDDIYYAEALCKSLKACAIANQSLYTVDESGIRREEVGGTEIEYFEYGTNDPWGKYIESLKDLCPLFGYSPVSTIGIKINSGDKPDPLKNCRKNNCDLQL